MTCPEFLERYTDFRDGLITAPREVRRFTRHLAQCPSCRRHDGAVRRGVLALQAADTVTPSADFRYRLERRLRREGLVAGPVLPARAGVAAALFIAVAIALIAFEGARHHEIARARSEEHTPELQSGLQLVCHP